MSRLKARFEKLKAEGRKGLIPYLTAGDPDPKYTVDFMHRLVETGADIIEFGVPFSDPAADGPVIQKACERALVHKTSIRNVLDMVARFREKDNETPVVLMGYLNPIEIMGYEAFVSRASACGVDGLLTVDMPPEEAGELAPMLLEHEIDPVFMLTPTSTPERVKQVGAHASGFIYYVSLKGVTGSAALNPDDVAQKLQMIRQYLDIPLAVGFGIRDAESAASIAKVADAVVVGSALVKRIADLQDTPEKIADDLAQLMTELRQGIDQVC